MASDTTADYVSTSDVAKALGVSVSTVKRWVDDGVLPAHKTAGGHRKLLRVDVLEMVRRGNLPQADLSQLVVPGRDFAPPASSDLAEDIFRSLLAGDGDRVRQIILGCHRRGMAIETLADDGIRPAMAKIGHEWEVGKIEVMEEHRASQLCVAALYELKSVLEKRASRNGPRAVGGAPARDFSVLPSLLAQMVLLDAGWEAINLGPDTPFRSLAKAIRDLRPRLVWLSVSHLSPEEDFLADYRDFYRQAEKAGVAVAIGGRALQEAIRSEVPYTTYGDGLSHLAAFARALNPKLRPPRRGRPPRP